MNSLVTVFLVDLAFFLIFLNVLLWSLVYKRYACQGKQPHRWTKELVESSPLVNNYGRVLGEKRTYVLTCEHCGALKTYKARNF